MSTMFASYEQRSRILKVFQGPGLRAPEHDAPARVGPRPNADLSALVKRGMDLCLAAGLFVLLAPLFLFIAVRIKQDSPGPVFYRGPRMGKGGKVFGILKFRTMYERPESYAGPRVTAHDDMRMTPLGRRLRDTKLNELPQLWNVLVGDMSLVGPRPEDPQLSAALPPEVRQEVLSVRPGITSPASVLFRDEEKLFTPGKLMDLYMGSIMPSKLRLDQLYVRHRSLLMDMDTLFWTLLVLPSRLRANPDEERLFLGPFELFMRRFASWFMIDTIVMLLAMGATGVVWRSFVVLDVGLWPALWIAVGAALLNSVMGVMIGVNSTAWSRASFTDALDLIPALLVTTATAVMANGFWFGPQPLLPQPLIFTAAALAFGGFVAVRYRNRLGQAMARRWVKGRDMACLCQERVLIVGAGECGQVMALWLRSGRINKAFRVMGFVDDDLHKTNTRIAGIQVLGKCDHIQDLVARHDVGVVLFAIHRIPDEERARLMALCSQTLARVVTAPNMPAALWGGAGEYDVQLEAATARGAGAPAAVQNPIARDEVAAWLAELRTITRAGNLDAMWTKIDDLQAQLAGKPAAAGHAAGQALFNDPTLVMSPRPRPNMKRARVLIVDDSTLIRERLVAQLQQLEGVEIVGQAETAEQAISALRELKPDAMTLDLRLPDGNGLNVLRLVQDEHLPTAVIVFTSYPHPQYEKRALAAGAYAFLNKARDIAKITDLLQGLISGGQGTLPQVAS